MVITSSHNRVSSAFIFSSNFYKEIETKGLTNTDSEGKKTSKANHIFDKVGLTGADQGGGWPVVFVIVRGAGETV